MAPSTRILSSRTGPKKPAIVIDLGSAFIRCGFAGDPHPLRVIPSVIGNHATESLHSAPSFMPGGDEADRARGHKRGLVRTRQEWEEVLTEVFSRLYTESLQCRPRERRVVICESMVSPRALREAVAHVLFRYLQVPSIHICAGPSPALYCTGLDTGIIVDIGCREAHVVAVYRGSSLPGCYSGVPLGCRAVLERVRELLAEDEDGSGGHEEEQGAARGERPLSWEELEDVMVRACLVPVGGVPSPEEVAPMEFVYPGKRKVTASGVLRTTAVQEALFEGDEEGHTLATLVLDCLGRCPRDCRRALIQNIVVAGGGALVPGLCARLAEEIRALAAPRASDAGDAGTGAPSAGIGKSEGYAGARAVVSGAAGRGDDGGGNEEGVSQEGLRVVRVPVRRDILVWTGASIMASLDGLGERSLTSERYLAREGGMLPDWMSVSSADWVFESAATVAAASV